ncbi:hypothetical protein BH09SUM1_BH09SUM1_33680 [soil metagenome]
MSKPHFLMCRPDHYNVDYVINPWMKGNLNRPNQTKAQIEWNAFAGALREKAVVSAIPQTTGLPDMVFAANGAFVLNNIATVANYRHKERQGESALYEAWLESHGYVTKRIAASIAFEGAGDALHDSARSIIWAAWGFRSDVESHAPLAEIYGVRVVSLHLVDERFYHLDTCFAPLDSGHVLYFPEAFDAESLKRIEEIVPRSQRIIVSREDAALFVCNAVEADGDIFVNDCSHALEQRIAATGLRLRRSHLSQFLMAGGANRCLTLRLDVAYQVDQTSRADALQEDDQPIGEDVHAAGEKASR